MTSLPIEPPLISLCIPTYNRAALLNESLRAIVAQWDSDLTAEQREGVEIVISDNASPDETLEMVVGIGAEYPGLRLNVFSQSENKGFDANIWTVIRRAQGTYVYVVSDDDILLPGGLAKIVALIRDYPDVPVFYLNTKSFVHTAEEKTKKAFALKEDRHVQGRDKCLQFLGTWITFVSCIVFRRGATTERDYADRIGTGFLHSYFYIDVLKDVTEMVATAQPFLAVRGDNSGGYNFFEFFVTRFADLMRYARTLGYSEETEHVVLSRHLKKFILPFVVTFKLRGSFGQLQTDFRDGVRRLLKVYGPRPFLLFVLFPLMFVPRGVVQSVHRVVRGGKKRRIGQSGVQ
jgi:abequosyltransferase